MTTLQGPSADVPVPDVRRALPAARSWRSAVRRGGRCRVVVGGRSGPRSRVWTVTATGADLVVTREDGAADGPTRSVHRGGRRIVLPAGPSWAVPGTAVQSPAPGWHAGAVLVVPLPALCRATAVVPDGTRRVTAPPPGHHVQVVLLLGEAAAPPLGLPSAQDAGGLPLPGGGRVQLWSHHVPNGPRSPDRARDEAGPGDDGGVPVVVDPGAGAAAGRDPARTVSGLPWPV